MSDPRRRSRTLGLIWIGALFGAGGLAGLVRAGQHGASRVRMIIACTSLAIGLACALGAWLQRRDRS